MPIEDLHAKLTQVMVHVKISPAQPVRHRHEPKNRMGVSADGSIWNAEALNGLNQSRPVIHKVHRAGSANSLLDFRTRRHVLRPSGGKIEREPLDHRTRKRT